MSNLKKIKEKMVGIKKTAKVTKAMESISAIKMREAQKKAILGREHSFLLFSIMKRLSKVIGKNVDEVFSDFSQDKKGIGVLLISPDKGLTGGMNNFLFKKVESFILENNFNKDELKFICIGKKGFEYLEKRGYKVEKYFSDINEKNIDNYLMEVSEYIEKNYRDNEFGKFYLIYTQFINTAEQKSKIRPLLPISFKETKEVLKEILPNKGKYSDLEKIDIDDIEVEAYIFEPSIEEVVKNLIPFVLQISIYNVLLESFASEHSSRMLAMKNSTDKANELVEKNRKKFNKERQAQITKEISEIVSGTESLKEK